VSRFATKLTLVGGPTILIEIAGARLLTDPTFDPPSQYASKGIVLEKKTGPALTTEAVSPIDAVLLSHDQHFDNLDHAGRAFLPNARRTFSTQAAAGRFGPLVTGMSPWETVTLETKTGGRLHLTATPARHGPAGIEPIAGDVTGFLVGVDRPGDAIYVTGDTVWYSGVAEVAKRFPPRLVIVFAGAAKPRGPFHVTMDNNDAIETAHAFPQARILAIHNSGWAHFTETQADAVQGFTTLGVRERLQTMDPGDTLSLQL
jgi:L-ascorbate metabolism protein UlaG (beta-lactamase superfamily)